MNYSLNSSHSVDQVACFSNEKYSVENKQTSGYYWGHHTSKNIVRLVWDVMALSRVNCRGCNAVDHKA